MEVARWRMLVKFLAPDALGLQQRLKI